MSTGDSKITYALPFHVVVPSVSLCKAIGDTADGEPRRFHGPIAPEDEDYDGDIITKAGLSSGLPIYKALGAHVDWAHRYPPTKNPKWLIGTGIDKEGPDGRPWLETTLCKAGKVEAADECWNHLQAEKRAGYSLFGLMKARDANNPKHIISTEIQLITVDPQPKGFSNVLHIGSMASPSQLAKAAVSAIESGGFEDTWLPLNSESDFDALSYYALTAGAQEEIVKALLGTNRLLKAAAEEAMSRQQRKCRKCGTKNRLTRTVCRNKNCAHDLGEDCPHCSTQGERGDNGKCNRCGEDWPQSPGRKLAKGLRTGFMPRNFDDTEVPLARNKTPSAGFKRSDTPREGIAKNSQQVGPNVIEWNAPQVRCPKCDRKNRCWRTKCHTCRASLAGAKLAKALTTGSAAVVPGDSGGMALRRQTLEGGSTAKTGQSACPDCGVKNKASRKVCRNADCGKTLRR